MTFAAVAELEEEFQLRTYKKMNIAIERGQGSWVWTSEGERYLDLYGGHAVCSTGHSHPLVVKAITEQAGKLLFYSNLVYSDIRAKAAAKLVSVAPKSITKAFFCNSGTEANENAMRMARLVTGREKIVSFEGGFHGRTADSISASFLGKYSDLGRPNVPGHERAVFGDIESVRAVADERTAAVILEPIQSMAGVREVSPQFFHDLRTLCGEMGIVLIFDEVQTGMGRTGGWFFADSAFADSVVPDIITLAKSLGSGVPVGACLTNDWISGAITENDLGTTFGGGMIAMAAVLATIEAIEQEGMLRKAQLVEQEIRRLAEKVDVIRSVRGKGCLLGIEMDRPAAAIHAALLDAKIITGTSSDPNVLRLLPPLCLSKDEIGLFASVLESL